MVQPHSYLEEEFLVELFSEAIRAPRLMDTLVSNLKRNWMPNESWQTLYDTMLTFYKSYSVVPSLGILKQRIGSDNEEVTALLDGMDRSRRVSVDALLSELEEYIKQSWFVSVYEELADLYNKNDTPDKAYKHFLDNAEKFRNFTLKGADLDQVFGGFERRQTSRLAYSADPTHISKIPFGIAPLDQSFNGGGTPGEVTMVCAQTGVGKSILCVHCGISAARIRIPVLHFQLEGTHKQVMDRYDAAWTGTVYRDLEAMEMEGGKWKKIARQIRKVGMRDIYVKTYENFERVGIPEMRNIYWNLRKKIGYIGLVIFDYFELADPGEGHYKPGDERLRQSRLGEVMKSFAVEANCHVITPTQANDIPMNLLNDPDFVITRNNLSENRGKTRPLDNFITLNQTENEYYQQVVRIHTDKARDSERAHGPAEVIQDRKRARFVDRIKTAENMEAKRIVSGDEPTEKDNFEDAEEQHSKNFDLDEELTE
jgi:hypothetical protein